jgi:glycosyltransferase involved in cell wall biosynthesis
MSGAWVAEVVADAAASGACCWIYLLGMILAHRHSLVWLRDVPAEPPAGAWPTLAVVFAARNEAAAVEPAVRSMLALDYPGVEIIAVDDRSTDGTGETLDALAREDPRLRVVHVRELPAGWLGKTHALQSAAETSAAEWVLFTDADVVLAPDTLRRAVAYACAQWLDFLTATPDNVTDSFGERVFLAWFNLAFAMATPPWRVADRRSKAALGVGAFNLIKAEVFRAVGGFRNVALSVDDDLRLAQAVKFAGYRCGAVLGQGCVSVRWQVGLGGMVRGLEKNFFAALDFRLTLAVVGVLAVVLVGVLPFVGLFVGAWWKRAVCAAGIASATAITALARAQSGVRWYHAMFLPLGALAFTLALVRSVWLTLRRGGVRWRDHHYPIEELTAHVRRRNAWAREVWRSTR